MAPTRPGTRPLALAGVCLLALGLALYWPARSHGFLNYDDPLYVTENPDVQRGLAAAPGAFAPDAIVAANWHPVTMVSHMADWQWFGEDAGGHHATSHVLHALNAILVLLVLVRLGASLSFAAFVAALFLVHPVNVGSVAWVAERKNVLSTTFWLAAILAHVAMAAGPRRVITVTALGILGLMAKPMLVTLPFTLLLLDLGPLGRRQEGLGTLLREQAGLFGAVLVFIAVTLAVQSESDAVSELPFSARAANAVASYGAYLKDLAWPGMRSIFLPHPGRDVAGSAVAGGLVALVGGSLVAWRLRGPAVTAWLWYLGTLVPVLGLVQVGDQARADRYLYVPALGIFVLLGLIGAAAVRRRPSLRRPAIGIAVVLVAAAAWHARGELRAWRDSETLFRHALARDEANYLAHNNLATALERRGDLGPALSHYQRSVELHPTWATSRMNLGIVHLRRREAPAAEEQLRLALRMRPDWAEAHSNLGAALMLQRRFGEAVAELERAVQLDPSLAEDRNNLERARQYHAQEGNP